MGDGTTRTAATGRSTWFVHELVSVAGLAGFAAVLVLAWIAHGTTRIRTRSYGTVELDHRMWIAVAAIGAAVVVLLAWKRASEHAADAFFVEFAPTLGLTYAGDWALAGGTPLLAAGVRRSSRHAMVGPAFGYRDPEWVVCHYTYEVERQSVDESGVTTSGYEPHRFTVCRTEIPETLGFLRSIYLRRRQRIRLPGVLWDDWLSGWSTEEIDLESAQFERLYEVRAGRDQDRLVVPQLFSPSFVLWLAEHPLRPGFELRGSALAVFVPGSEGKPDQLAQLYETAREIAGRIRSAASSQVAHEAGTHFSAAGHTIR